METVHSVLPFVVVLFRSGLGSVAEVLFVCVRAGLAPYVRSGYNRAGVSKFDFGCFQNATGSSSARKGFPELRIELTTSLEHAGEM